MDHAWSLDRRHFGRVRAGENDFAAARADECVSVGERHRRRKQSAPLIVDVERLGKACRGGSGESPDVVTLVADDDMRRAAAGEREDTDARHRRGRGRGAARRGILADFGVYQTGDCPRDGKETEIVPGAARYDSRQPGHSLIEDDPPVVGQNADQPHLEAAYVGIFIDSGRQNDLPTAYVDDIGRRGGGATGTGSGGKGRSCEQSAAGGELVQCRADSRLGRHLDSGAEALGLRLCADHIDRTVRADCGRGDDRLAFIDLPAPERFAVRMQSDKLSFLRAEINGSIGSDDRTRAQRKRAEAGNAEGAPGSRLRIHIGEPPIGGVAMETFPGANRRSRSLHDHATHRGGCNSDEWSDHFNLPLAYKAARTNA